MSAVDVFFLLIPIVTLCGVIYILQRVTISVWASQVALLVKNLPANAGYARDVGSIPGSGRCPGGRHGYAFQYPCLENSMNREAWQAAVHGVTKSWTRLKQLSTRMRAHTHTHTHTALLRAGYILLRWHRLQRKIKTIGIY